MRILVGFLAVGLLLLESGGMAKPMSHDSVISPPVISKAATSSTKGRIDFDTQIKPILASKCMPCHFQGGKMYDRLPFDRPETIRKLGKRLFTRITEEKDRRLIEDFLTQDHPPHQ
jgi:hypothetical protein